MTSRIVLPLSLALNVVCVAILIWRIRAPATGPEPAPQSAPAPLVAEPQPQPAAPPFHWSQVESTNYFVYIANLRAVKCPEQTIRDIICADLLAAMRSASADSPTGREAAEGMAVTQATRLANHLLHPQTVPFPGPAQKGTVLLPASETPAASLDYAAENERVAAMLESRRAKRLEAIQRNWVVDSIRARYGVEALLGWQQQASREGISFDEFVRRHQVPISPLVLQR